MPIITSFAYILHMIIFFSLLDNVSPDLTKDLNCLQILGKNSIIFLMILQLFQKIISISILMKSKLSN